MQGERFSGVLFALFVVLALLLTLKPV